jgi:hypothetical protein
MHWAPNREAARQVQQFWPSIRAAVPTARLLMVGRGTENTRGGEGVERLGFVENIDAIWGSVGILLAPVPVGGGVRVKILDAARRGVPVVANRAAIGSVDEYLPVSPALDEPRLIQFASELLADRSRRQRAGSALFEANRELAHAGFVERQLETLFKMTLSRS